MKRLVLQKHKDVHRYALSLEARERRKERSTSLSLIIAAITTLFSSPTHVSVPLLVALLATLSSLVAGFSVGRSCRETLWK